MVFCVKKVFRNFTKEKSLNREKDLWFVTDFSPDFSNRERLMRSTNIAVHARLLHVNINSHL